MPGPDLPIRFNREGTRFVTYLEVGNAYRLRALLGPNFPGSVISRNAADDLINLELLPPLRQQRYMLRSLISGGQSVPDFEARVLPQVTRFGVDLVLGLDFLAQFSELHFYWATLTLVLVDP